MKSARSKDAFCHEGSLHDQPGSASGDQATAHAETVRGNCSEDNTSENGENEKLTGEPVLPSPVQCGDRLKGCSVCGSLPFQKAPRNLSNDLLWTYGTGAEFDGGLHAVIRQFHGQEMQARVSTTLADQTVKSAIKQLNILKEELMRSGLQKIENQNFSGESINSARVIAPFDVKEIIFGRVLGTGGFSVVHEVTGFRPLSSRALKRRLHPTEKLSRNYLLSHVHTHDQSPKDIPKNQVSSNLEKPAAAPQPSLCDGLPISRYAVKHLRNGFVNKSPKKFKRAAIDLVLEAQLLLVLDHPHIVSIRGWSIGGPQAFSSGNPRDYFLILDRLPVSLEESMAAWRMKLTKYANKWRRRTKRKQNCRQVSSFLLKRFGSQNLNEASQPPDKFELKIRRLFLERLQVAADIASAVAYLHSKRIIHRDLKLTNIGFDTNGVVKVFDFGLSRTLPQIADDDTFFMSRVGTKFYIAPEIRRKEPYNCAADVYSFGVVLWEILSLSTAKDLYHEHKTQAASKTRPDVDWNAQKQRVTEGDGSWLPLCPCWPQLIKNLVTNTLVSDPKKRPTMPQVQAELQQQIDIFVRDTELGNGGNDVMRRRSTFRLDLTGFNMSELDNPSFDDAKKCSNLHAPCGQ